MKNERVETKEKIVFEKLLLKRKTMQRERIGILQQQILTALFTGLFLGIYGTARRQMAVLRDLPESLRNVPKQRLQKSLEALYGSHLVDLKKNRDGSLRMVLNEQGHRRALCYSIDKLKIDVPPKWDGLWRAVVFDIPVRHNRERRAFRLILKELGFFRYQHSVFVHPYDCRELITFLRELWKLNAHVRFLEIVTFEDEAFLRQHFKLKF